MFSIIVQIRNHCLWRIQSNRPYLKMSTRIYFQKWKIANEQMQMQTGPGGPIQRLYSRILWNHGFCSGSTEFRLSSYVILAVWQMLQCCFFHTTRVAWETWDQLREAVSSSVSVLEKLESCCQEQELWCGLLQGNFGFLMLLQPHKKGWFGAAVTLREVTGVPVL